MKFIQKPQELQLPEKQFTSFVIQSKAGQRRSHYEACMLSAMLLRSALQKMKSAPRNLHQSEVKRNIPIVQYGLIDL